MWECECGQVEGLVASLRLNLFTEAALLYLTCETAQFQTYIEVNTQKSILETTISKNTFFSYSSLVWVLIIR